MLFSTVVEMMMLVGLRPSLHAAARESRTRTVSLAALYDKVNRTEPALVRALVSASAERLAPVMEQVGGRPTHLAGYQLRIIDGNHLPASEKRLKLLREVNGAALPGQALVDTDGRALILQVHAASIQDRDGAVPLLRQSRRAFPFIERVFGDSAYNAERVANTTLIFVEIVRKMSEQVGFVVLPRRWVVERFFAWINRNRRFAKDFEASIASATAFLYAASVMLFVRRLARFA